MTYYELVQEVLRRVNDPLGDTYLDEAKEMMFDGLSSIVRSGDYIPEDCPYLYRTTTLNSSADLSSAWSIITSGSGNELTELGTPVNVMKIIDIVEGDSAYYKVATIGGAEAVASSDDNGTLTYPLKYIKMSRELFNRAMGDASYAPLSNEVFYTIEMKGELVSLIKFIPTDRVADVDYKITYVVTPDPAQYVYGTSASTSTDISEQYSNAFLYKVIDYAVGKIQAQIGGQ